VRRRGRVVVRIAALVAATGAAGTIAAARPPDASPAGNERAPAAGAVLRTPLWSPRRLPALFTEAAARARLGRALEAAVAPYDACVAVEDGTGSLARVRPEVALAPASAQKLATAAAALAVLGPDSRFTTRVLAGDGGALVLVGGGDPVLATPAYIERVRALPTRRTAVFTSLATLADAVVAAGVRAASSIVVDDARHERVRFLEAWKPTYARTGDIGSLGALTVDGGFAGAETEEPATDPALSAGGRLAELLQARGVLLTGGVLRGDVPANAREVARVDSPPVAEIVASMLKSSDNYTAEQILREVGYRDDPGRPGTTEGGVAAMLSALRERGVPLAGFTPADGSGLSPFDRARCPTLLALVRLAGEPHFAAIGRGLAVAGVDGTLVHRFLGDPLAGRLRAKTGSLAGVVALAGVIDGDEPRRFALVAAGPFSNDEGQRLQERAARAVAGYPEPVDPTALVPAP
jgi:D-alanyl-D-alanine carboxypeptidase/D-alanyl-D-alanine-endopeptidase (penicillin-binding protein 4)